MGPRILAAVLLLIMQPPPKLDTAGIDPSEKALQWLLAMRMAHQELSAEQIRSLEETYERLTPSQLRVLVMVYEKTYGVVAPFEAEERKGEDATQAAREWLLAYRIVHDRLTPKEAKEYEYELSKMSPRQIRILAMAYEEKDKIQRQNREYTLREQQTKDDSEEEKEAKARLQQAKQTQAVERQRRQIALARAGGERRQTDRNFKSVNSAGTGSAKWATQIMAEQRAYTRALDLQKNSFNNRMYERGSYGWGGGWRYGWGW